MTPLPLSGPAGRFGVPQRLVLGGVLSLTLLTPALLLAAVPAAADALAFQRAAVGEGEWWRLVTCHWSHWTPDHLFWDLLAFTILLPLCWLARPGRMLAALALSVVLIPLAVWVGIPGMTEYRGLSGLDSALFVFLASHGMRRAVEERDRGAMLLYALPLLAFASKIGFEIFTGEAMFARSESFVPVPLAHLVGATCGALAAWASSARSGQSAPRQRRSSPIRSARA